MKGRGTRVITPTSCRRVTPDANGEDALRHRGRGGCGGQPKGRRGHCRPETHYIFEKLVESLSFGRRDEDAFEALARRLARLEGKLSEPDRQDVLKVLDAGNVAVPAAERRAPLGWLAQGLFNAHDLDVAEVRARADGSSIPEAKTALAQEAARPFELPKVREVLLALQKKNEITLDTVSQDKVLTTGFDAEAAERARATIKSFRQFIEQNKDAITALQLIFQKNSRGGARPCAPTGLRTD